jgi:hypothetical protein
MRTFNIYLQRSGDAKGKSMRQMLLVLTNVITKNQSPRAIELGRRATSSFLDITCEREDRIKVKPALQGLAHFLLRDVISITELIGLFDEQLRRTSDAVQDPVTSRTVFKSFLAWVVHHDTALSAGHLIKNYLLQARRLADYDEQANNGSVSPFWIEPVAQTLRDWPDRIQEFRTHVFPHCFLPNLSEYLRFLAFLHFESHVPHKNALPRQLNQAGGHASTLEGLEEFRILLAAIATGKELNIVKDNGRYSPTLHRGIRSSVYQIIEFKVISKFAMEHFIYRTTFPVPGWRTRRLKSDLQACFFAYTLLPLRELSVVASYRLSSTTSSTCIQIRTRIFAERFMVIHRNSLTVSGLAQRLSQSQGRRAAHLAKHASRSRRQAPVHIVQ